MKHTEEKRIFGTLWKMMVLASFALAASITAINSSVDQVSAAPKLTDVSPKIFSPDEGDKVLFSFNSLADSNVDIKIFNLSGAEVRTGLEKINSNSNVMYWDGKNNDRKIVDGGIYIYQVDTEDDMLNGALVVVK